MVSFIVFRYLGHYCQWKIKFSHYPRSYKLYQYGMVKSAQYPDGGHEQAGDYCDQLPALGLLDYHSKLT